MGLGDFADSSRGSASSSRSGGQGEGVKGEDEILGQEEQQPVEEEDSNGSGQEEKMDEGTGEPSFPRVPTPSSERRSSFTLGNNEGGGGGGAGRSGGAAFDDAVDGLEDDEDWHFALPMGSLEDVPMGKANRTQPGVGNNATQDDPFANQPREEEEEEQDREGSSGSANTSHSSQDRSPDNSQGKAACTPEFRPSKSLGRVVFGLSHKFETLRSCHFCGNSCIMSSVALEEPHRSLSLPLLL